MNNRANFEKVKKAYENWPVCPITQDKIIIPAAVTFKQNEDSSVDSVRYYEFSNFSDYFDECNLNGKPVLDVVSKQPVSNSKLSLEKVDEFIILAKDAKDLAIISSSEFEQLIDNCLIGQLHAYVVLHNEGKFLENIIRLKALNKMSLANRSHYSTDKPLLFEIIKHSAQSISKSRNDTFSRTMLDIFVGHREIDLGVVDDCHRTGLMIAAQAEYLYAFELLLLKCAVTHKDDKGANVLDYILDQSTISSMPIMFRMAIDAGADILSYDRKNNTSLGKLIMRMQSVNHDGCMALLHCLQYVCQKQPEKVVKHSSLPHVDDGRDLFAFCMTQVKLLKAAQYLIEAGYPSLNFNFTKNQGEIKTALHVLASMPNDTTGLYEWNVISRMIEFLALSGLHIDLVNAEGNTFYNIMRPTPLLVKPFSINITLTDLLKAHNWTYFANNTAVLGSIFIDATLKKSIFFASLIDELISKPQNTFQYKIHFAVIMNKLVAFSDGKLPKVSLEGKEIAIEYLAIRRNNLIALQILFDEKILSTSATKLLSYAEMMHANDNVTSFLKAKITPVSPVPLPLTRVRRNSMNSIFSAVLPSSSSDVSSSQRSLYVRK